MRKRRNEFMTDINYEIKEYGNDKDYGGYIKFDFIECVCGAYRHNEAVVIGNRFECKNCGRTFSINTKITEVKGADYYCKKCKKSVEVFHDRNETFKCKYYKCFNRECTNFDHKLKDKDVIPKNKLPNSDVE